ncbi:filamentous hemagglutinin N-terminal domain-containing protein [Trichocoleus sp. DQ-A3]|uniref:two-partner secretion domain-containing protein n=1 Tax=Cyanophyceae TaxID=3028117 RepID=UPI001684D6E6|nr:filamentous hemagglutinin N-terminal domain-containing protein [Coleofasciculus sp. FACHB-125]MBD1899434.1 filamentous hemagglutinin N-terminal domain-containing protein [Coleofasciculus sp. FACHB-125]
MKMKGFHLEKWLTVSSVLSALCSPNLSTAQVVGDTTLPIGERSQVTGNPNFQIDGGARRGANLFHSLSQFSIPTGGSAFFNNAIDVQNILTRVTGGSISNIDGLIRTNGTANLFLLNPNGIIFGANASLNVGGSFIATTADAMGLANGDIFSANPGQPLPSQLLNVNPNAFFFNQLAAQAIINRSTANNGIGLQVPAGQSLLLVGGNVGLEGGQIVSPGSRVELGAVAGQGTVGLSETAGDWQLSFPDGVVRADVFLSNSSLIDVRGGGGGSMTITARNLTLNGGSTLRVGIEDGLGFAGAQTGDIQLDVTEAINLTDGSLISIRVGSGSTGNAGSINITTGSLSVTGTAQLGSDTFGQGNTGSININARDTVSWSGDGVIGGTAVQPTAVGNAGDFNITTGSLSITNGAKLGSVTRGQGNTGSVNIVARDTVSMDGFGSLIASGVDPTGVGNSGDINITTGSLSLTNSGQVSSYTRGQGNTGRVNIIARDRVFLDGQVSNYSSAIFSLVTSTGVGNGGGINITTGSLSLTGGSQLTSSTLGQGDAGSININARDRVSIDGAAYGGFKSDILTQVESGATGQGGDVYITTGSLSLTNGGSISTGNFGGIGNAGRVTINARDSVQISGTATVPIIDIDNRSRVVTSVSPEAVGSGGDVGITTGSLSVSNQGRIITNTEGQGQAGNIQIQASGTVSFDGGDAISTLEPSGSGRGGDIEIAARSLWVLNNAQLSASTFGEGDAGNITTSADTVGLSSGGRLLTTTFSGGQAGDIRVNTPDLQLSGASSGLFAQTTTAADAGNVTVQPLGDGQRVRVTLQDGAQISASTEGSGRGGTLTITAPDSITLTGNGSVITAGTGSSGAGGNLNLRTGTLNIQDRAEVTVSSSGTGIAGNLEVDAERIFLNNGGRIRADTTGGGGNINLRSPLILLRNGSSISTNATGGNIPGGNIRINTDNLVAVPSENSDISANSEDFRGGNVTVRANGIFGIEFREQMAPLSDITATGVSSDFNGTVDIITPGIDPARGLAQLPTEVVDASDEIAQGCPASQGNSFVVTGRGGLPPTPEQQLDDDAEWLDRRRLTVAQQTPHPTPRTSRARISNPRSYTPIIEATGWQMTPTGKVILFAATPDLTVPPWLNQPVTCPSRR